MLASNFKIKYLIIILIKYKSKCFIIFSKISPLLNLAPDNIAWKSLRSDAIYLLTLEIVAVFS